MRKEYCLVDEEGKIKQVDFFYPEDEIPKGYVRIWEGILQEPMWNHQDHKWIENTNKEEELEKIKESKYLNLREECSIKILSGFYFEIKKRKFHFSYDKEAQLNFQDTYNVFQNNLLEKIGWTVSFNGIKERIFLNKKEFSLVYVEAIRHKNETLNYLYEDLLKKLKLAKSKEEIEAIKWGKISKELIVNISETLDRKVENIDNVTKESEAQKAYNGYTESMLMEVIDIALMGVSG